MQFTMRDPTLSLSPHVSRIFVLYFYDQYVRHTWYDYFIDKIMLLHHLKVSHSKGLGKLHKVSYL